MLPEQERWRFEANKKTAIEDWDGANPTCKLPPLVGGRPCGHAMHHPTTQAIKYYWEKTPIIDPY